MGGELNSFNQHSDCNHDQNIPANEHNYLINDYSNFSDIKLEESNFYLFNNEEINKSLNDFLNDLQPDDFISSEKSLYFDQETYEELINNIQIEKTKALEEQNSITNENNFNNINNENRINQELNGNEIVEQKSNLDSNNNESCEKDEICPEITINKEHKKQDNKINDDYLEENNKNKKSTKESSSKTFIGLKRGPLKKIYRKLNLKYKRHTREYMDNAIKKFINDCNRKIHKFISKILKGQKFNVPTIKDKMGNKYEEIILFIQNSYYYISIYSIPKNCKLKEGKTVKKLTEEEKQKIYDSNKKNIEQIISEDYSKDNSKIIEVLFNLTFKDYLDAYINDNKFIDKNGNIIQLEGFETFRECFNEGEKRYTLQRKDQIKKKIKEEILK